MNRKHIAIWTLLLVAADIGLTLLAYLNGSLRSGRSPTLDLWDLAKALAIGALLLDTARRVRSKGLVVLGGAAILVGLAGATHLHGWLGGVVAPGAASQVAKFGVLAAVVVVSVAVLYAIKDSWEGFPTARRIAVLVLLGLLIFGGLVDLLATFRGASTVEETGERLILSFALACAITQHANSKAPHEPHIRKGPRG